ncbi:hypothetical protein O181_097479 [Austropuccinia psidii MF-1]|uniref:Uncharacterized protein n=1 Tax=Austropuccinia psidii MF-1 TaxID=1389203 RepID=A0A9Q3PDM9_9BASI|nr:hypothetical protein [Austropuccinia psidii MF-1]
MQVKYHDRIKTNLPAIPVGRKMKEEKATACTALLQYSALPKVCGRGQGSLTSHHIKDGQHSPVLANYNLTCFKTCDAEEDNHFIVMPYLNIETRGRIIGMRQAGLPFRAILDSVGIPLLTVYDTVAKFQVIGTVRTQKKTGRPPIMTDRDQ